MPPRKFLKHFDGILDIFTQKIDIFCFNLPTAVAVICILLLKCYVHVLLVQFHFGCENSWGGAGGKALGNIQGHPPPLYESLSVRTYYTYISTYIPV